MKFWNILIKKVYDAKKSIVDLRLKAVVELISMKKEKENENKDA